MTEAPTKIRMKIGGVEIAYEGPEGFLDEKLPKLLNEVSVLAEKVLIENSASDEGRSQKSGTPSTLPLPSFLKEKSANNQTMRFLATAQWLHEKGTESIKTNDVTKALRDSKQKRLGNASECLNINVSKGFCEKTSGGGFFVTDEGRQALR